MCEREPLHVQVKVHGIVVITDIFKFRASKPIAKSGMKSDLCFLKGEPRTMKKINTLTRKWTTFGKVDDFRAVRMMREMRK